MSIQQALFAGSSGSAGWTLVDTWSNYTQGRNVSMPDTQSGDMLLAFAGRRNQSDPPSNIGNFSTIIRGDLGLKNLGYGVFARVCSGATSFSTTNMLSNTDYVFYCAFRASSALTNTSSVSWKDITSINDNNAPTHANTIKSFGMNSLALPAVWFSRTVTSTWVPPANATLVGSHNEVALNAVLVAVSSQEIGAAGNYSWGAWGQTDISNDWLTGYV